MNSEELSEEIFNVMKRFSKIPMKRCNVTSDIVKGEHGVLGYLLFQKSEASAGELKENMCVGSGRMADILKSLENKGYIVRKPDKLDGRKVMVSLTDEGKAHAGYHKEIMRQKHIKLIEYLGEKDALEALRIMKRITEYLENERNEEETK